MVVNILTLIWLILVPEECGVPEGTLPLDVRKLCIFSFDLSG